MMFETKHMLAGGVALVALAFAVQASAVEFEPFTEVENVCPDCEQPKSDEIELSSGENIRCTIVAANDDFWVIERYGEVRAVPDTELVSKSYADGSPPSDLRSQDQIVTKDGHVVTGTIVDESDSPGHYQLKSSIGSVSFVIFKKEAQALYRDGSKATIEMPEEDGE